MKKTHHAFTTIELLATTAIIAFLAAVSIPVLQRSFESARTAECSNNLRQLGLAVLLYAAEHDMVFPATSHQAADGSTSWVETLQPYASGTVTFKCPSDDNKSRSRTYVMNDFFAPEPCGAPFLNLSKMPKTTRHGETILYFEAVATAHNPQDHYHFSDYFMQEIPPGEFSTMVAVNRHDGRANYLFADAHVETLTWKDVQARLAQPGSRFVDPTR